MAARLSRYATTHMTSHGDVTIPTDALIFQGLSRPRGGWIMAGHKWSATQPLFNPSMFKLRAVTVETSSIVGSTSERSYAHVFTPR